MMRIIRIGSFVAITLLLISELKAENKSIRLLGPEVTKLGWSTRAMTSSDMDGDGLNDIILINNDEAKIEILYQSQPGEPKRKKRAHSKNRWEPVLEDSRFIRESVVTGISMYDLAVADFNNDGRKDIAYTSKADGLTVFYQEEDETFSRKETFKQFDALPWTSTVVACDYNQDGLDDIVLLGKKSVLLYEQDEDEGLNEPSQLWLTQDNVFGLEVVDFNRDGLLDIQYLVSADERKLRIRMQDAEHGFGPEKSYRLKLGTGAIQYLKPDDDSVQFAYIQGKTGLIEILKPMSGASSSNENERSPDMYATASSEGAAASYALCDFNKNGLLDLALSEPDQSRVWIYGQNKHGLWNNAVYYPSLKNVVHLASGTFSADGDYGIVQLSSSENILGVSAFNDEGRLLFPRPIAIEGQAEVFTVADIDFEPDGIDEILLIESRKRDFFFNIVKKSDESGKFETTYSLKIDDLKRRPKGLEVGDFNQDGILDLLLLVERDASRFYSRDVAGQWVQVAEKSPMRSSLFNDIDGSRLGKADVNEDGKEELLVGNKGFIRALKMNQDNELEVIEQFNTRRSDDDIHLPRMFDFDNDGEKEVVFYVKNNGSLQVLKQDESGQYRYESAYNIGAMDPISSVVIEGKSEPFAEEKDGNKIEKKEPGYLLMLGKEKFWVLPLESEERTLEVQSSYETDLQNVFYNSITAADLNDDGTEELVLIDGKNHVLEVLRYEKDKMAWKSALHFTIFNQNLHYSGRKGASLEPREVLVADFTADGKQDVVLLVHDRLLLYPQGVGESLNSSLGLNARDE